MHEGVAPADDVPGRPPPLPERMVRFRDEHVLEAAGAVAVELEDLQLVQPLHVERDRALVAVDLPLEGVPAAERQPCRLDRPDRPVLELDGRLDRVVHLPAGEERLHERRHRRDLADEVAAEVDDVGAEIAERARAGLVRVEAPRRQRRVVAPVLQVAAAEMADLAELAGLDQLAGEPYGGDEAVVERTHVLDPGRGDLLPDAIALLGVASERLLANDVLAGLRGEDRRLGVHGVRAAVVEEANGRIGDELVRVGRPALVAVALSGLAHCGLVPAGDQLQLRHERRRPRQVRDLVERVRVRLAHEGVPEHSHADLLRHGPRYYAHDDLGDHFDRPHQPARDSPGP